MTRSVHPRRAHPRRGRLRCGRLRCGIWGALALCLALAWVSQPPLSGAAEKSSGRPVSGPPKKIAPPRKGGGPAPLVLWGRGTLLDRDRSSVGFGDLAGMANDLVALFLVWRNFTGNLPEQYSGLASAGFMGKGLGFFIVFGGFLYSRRWLDGWLKKQKERAEIRRAPEEFSMAGGAYDLAIAFVPRALFLVSVLVVFVIFELERKYLLAGTALVGGAAIYGTALFFFCEILFRSAPPPASPGLADHAVRLLQLLIQRVWRTCAWTLIPIATLVSLSYKPGIIDLLWVVFRIGLVANVLSVASLAAMALAVKKEPGGEDAGEAPKDRLAVHAFRLLLVTTAVALYAFYSFGYNNLTQYLVVGIFFSAFVVSIGWLALSRVRAQIEGAFDPERDPYRPSFVSPDQRRKFKGLSLRIVRVVFFAGTLIFLLILWGVDLYAVSWTFRLLSAPITQLGGVPISLGSLFKMAGIFFFFWWLSRYLRFLSQRRLERTVAGEAFRSNFSIGVGYLTMAIGIILALKSIGVDFTTLTVLAGVLGIGVGFGLQTISNNLISGIILLLERTVKPGDFIEVGDTSGVVQQVTLRSTVVRTLDNISVIVPNSNFVSNTVINWSHSEKITRGQVSVGVAYQTDTALVRECLLEAAKTTDDVLEYPVPVVFFKEFGDSSLNFELLFWYDEPKTMRRIKSDLLFAVEKILNQRGITIPFPQRDVHMIPPEDKPKDD